VAGDADTLGAGAGNLASAAARDIRLTCLLVDNGRCGLIHGLPTPAGAGRTVATALEAGASFVGSGWAGYPDLLADILARAMRHPGFAVVVAASPCVTYDAERITWERLNDAWRPVPSDHEAGDRAAALALVRREPFTHGVIYHRESGR
jgi:2-oxoglutarate ferredoxin oxidoreductase subunit beta